MSEQSAVSEAAAIIPGRLRQLRPGLACVTADNPGAMTGPGTNSYLVGEQKIAIIDPGPADDAHIAAMLAAQCKPVRIRSEHRSVYLYS